MAEEATVVSVTAAVAMAVTVTAGMVTDTAAMVMDTAVMVTEISELDWVTAAMDTAAMPLTRLGMHRLVPVTTVADTLHPVASSDQEFIARTPVVAGDRAASPKTRVDAFHNEIHNRISFEFPWIGVKKHGVAGIQSEKSVNINRKFLTRNGEISCVELYRI